MLKTWLPERVAAEQGHVLVRQGAEPGRATGAQAERASFPVQRVRYSLPPGIAAMESLPAPYLPPPEGESHHHHPLLSSSFLDEGASAVLSCLCGLCPSNSTGLPAADRTGVQAALALSSRLQRTGLPEGWGLGLGSG